MKCPYCGYVSFNYLDKCKKCGKDLADHKEKLNIKPIIHSEKTSEESQPTTESLFVDEKNTGVEEESTGIGITEAEDITIADLELTDEIPTIEDALSLTEEKQEITEIAGVEKKEVNEEPILEFSEEEAIAIGNLELADEIPTIEDALSLTEEMQEVGETEKVKGLEIGEEFDLSFSEEDEINIEGIELIDEITATENALPLTEEKKEVIEDSEQEINLEDFDIDEEILDFGFEEKTEKAVIEKQTLKEEVVTPSVETGISEAELPKEETKEPPVQPPSESEQIDEILSFIDPEEPPAPIEEEEEEEEEEVPQPTVEYPKVGFWVRALAFIVDNIVLSIIFLLFMFAGISALGLESARTGGSILDKIWIMAIPLYILGLLLCCGYFTFFHGLGGQTIGKMLMQIKVVQIDGTPLTYSKAFIRWIGYLISGLILNLGFIWVAFDKNKQGWHDKIASTYVIKVEP